jgi:hypothetical protein
MHPVQFVAVIEHVAQGLVQIVQVLVPVKNVPYLQS